MQSTSSWPPGQPVLDLNLDADRRAGLQSPEAARQLAGVPVQAGGGELADRVAVMVRHGRSWQSPQAERPGASARLGGAVAGWCGAGYRARHASLVASDAVAG